MKNILAASLVALSLAACSNLGESLSSSSSSDGTVSGSDSGTSPSESGNSASTSTSTSQSASGVSGSKSVPGDSGSQSGSGDSGSSGSSDSRGGSGSQSGSKGSGSGDSKVKFDAKDPGSKSNAGNTEGKNAVGKSVSKGSSKESMPPSGSDSQSDGGNTDGKNTGGKSVSKGSSKESMSTKDSVSASGSDSQSVTEYKGGDTFTADEERQFVTKVGDRVFFGYDRHTLTADAVKILQAQARWLKDRPDVKIVIEGHADERGTREYNLALGERRANSVRAFLVSLGIAKDRILIVSYGKERPAVAASNEAAWAQNRRGVTVLDD